MLLKGNRKFLATCLCVIVFTIIVLVKGDAEYLEVGGALTAMMTPFIAGNVSEHMADKNQPSEKLSV